MHYRADFLTENGIVSAVFQMIAGLGMDILIYVFSAVFVVLAAALLFTWWRERHIGALLLAMTYLIAAGLSFFLMEWFPLIIGFLSAWSLRLMGLDPGAAAAAVRKQER